MSIERLLKGRWARILGWALAGVTWGTTAVAVAAGAGEAEAAPVSTIPPPSDAGVTAPTTQAVLPDAPDNGLVILRFTPVPPPEPQVITRTVVASAPSGSTSGQSVTVGSSGS